MLLPPRCSRRHYVGCYPNRCRVPQLLPPPLLPLPLLPLHLLLLMPPPLTPLLPLLLLPLPLLLLLFSRCCRCR